MDRHCHEDLRVVTSRLAAMGELVESRVRDAVTAIEVMAQQPLAAQPDVIALSEVVLGMLHDSLNAFVEQDVTRATSFRNRYRIATCVCRAVQRPTVRLSGLSSDRL